jgi:hypothetical protein
LSDILSGEDAEAIMRTVIDQAKGGDLQACRMIFDRLHAPLKAIDTPIFIDLPEDATGATVAVLEAVGTGILTPEQGSKFMATIADAVRIREMTELEARVSALEAQQ